MLGKIQVPESAKHWLAHLQRVRVVVRVVVGVVVGDVVCVLVRVVCECVGRWDVDTAPPSLHLFTRHVTATPTRTPTTASAWTRGRKSGPVAVQGSAGGQTAAAGPATARTPAAVRRAAPAAG